MKKLLIILALISTLSLSCIPTIPDIHYMSAVPVEDGTLNLGSPTLQWNTLYVQNIIGPAGLGNVNTVGGTIGTIPVFTGATDIADSSVTEVQVQGAVTNSHVQNTDTILHGSGVPHLFDAGYLDDDLRTDRWLHSDTNTFLGVDVVGLDNLAHTGGSEGEGNTAFGHGALRSITTSYFNVAIGYQTLDALTTGIYNTAVGQGVLSNLVTGDFNTAIGMQALNLNTGSYNTAIGLFAGHTNIVGDNNVFIGAQAGSNELGSDKLYIDSSDTATPLIWGDFNTNVLTINGNLRANGTINYGADGGANDAYACTITGITAYVEGLVIYFNANTANTGACSVNVNTLGAIALKINGGSADPGDNWIIANEIVHCIYDGTNFQVLNPNATP